MLAGQDLEQRFFLRRIEGEAEAGDVIEKALEDLLAIRGSGRRRERRSAMLERISAVPTRMGASLFTEASPVTKPT